MGWLIHFALKVIVPGLRLASPTNEGIAIIRLWEPHHMENLGPDANMQQRHPDTRLAQPSRTYVSLFFHRASQELFANLFYAVLLSQFKASLWSTAEMKNRFHRVFSPLSSTLFLQKRSLLKLRQVVVYHLQALFTDPTCLLKRWICNMQAFCAVGRPWLLQLSKSMCHNFHWKYHAKLILHTIKGTFYHLLVAHDRYCSHVC